MIRIWERNGSGGGSTGNDNKSRQRIYGVKGTNDHELVTSLARAYSPYSIAGLRQGTVTPEPRGDALWQVTVDYERQQDQEPGTVNWSFETGGGTQHITQSIKTVGRYKRTNDSKAIPNFKGAIGVTKSSIDGCDISVPVFTFQRELVLDAARVTDDYVDTLFRLTASTNNKPFGRYKRGECLFLGSSGAPRGEDQVAITMHFAASPNRTGLQLGDPTSPEGAIGDIAKKGWECLWIVYEESDDGDYFTKVPAYVFVEQVYYEGDFDDLGIS